MSWRKAVTFSGNSPVRPRRAAGRSRFAASSRVASNRRCHSLGRELVRERDRRELRRVENLVGVGVADAAQDARIGERALERAVLGGQCGAECVEIDARRRRCRRGRSPRVRPRRAPRAATRGAWCRPRSGPACRWENRTRPGRCARPSFAPGGRQCSRPAIIRWSTSQRSPSRPIAMRLPMRRSSRTTPALDRRRAADRRCAAGTRPLGARVRAALPRCAARGR